MSGANDAALATSLRWREREEVSGYIDRAAWLSDDLLLLLGWFHAEPAQPLEACFIVDGEARPLEVRYTSYARPNTAIADETAGKLLTVRLLHPAQTSDELGRLVLKSGARVFSP